ncbi:MAG: SprT family zinc-dependent metalloprotease [Thermodesulfobacteriota bacterium]|nr:SprT family zinc-dependent metalloprotease [Thermodesulfobacteriota bacterium]
MFTRVRCRAPYFQGRRYRLDVTERPGRAQIRIVNNTTMALAVKPGTDTPGRWRVMERWYRRQLRAMLPALVEKWEPIIGVQVAETRIKRMKTRWESCNIDAGRIWVNLELIKKPVACLEYILVHEMVHLLERYHNERFKKFMDRFLPDWQVRRDELNRQPLPRNKGN